MNGLNVTWTAYPSDCGGVQSTGSAAVINAQSNNNC